MVDRPNRPPPLELGDFYYATLRLTESPEPLLRTLCSKRADHTIFSGQWLSENGIETIPIEPKEVESLWGTFTVDCDVFIHVPLGDTTYVLRGYGTRYLRDARVDVFLGRDGCNAIKTGTGINGVPAVPITSALPGPQAGPSSSAVSSPSSARSRDSSGVARTDVEELMLNYGFTFMSLEIFLPEFWRRFLSPDSMQYAAALAQEVQDAIDNMMFRKAKTMGFFALMNAPHGRVPGRESFLKVLYYPRSKFSYISRSWLCANQVPVEHINPRQMETPFGSIIIDSMAYVRILFGGNVVKIQMLATSTFDAAPGDAVLGADTARGLVLSDLHVKFADSMIDVATLEMQGHRGLFDCIVADGPNGNVFHWGLEAYRRLDQRVVLNFEDRHRVIL